MESVATSAYCRLCPALASLNLRCQQHALRCSIFSLPARTARRGADTQSVHLPGHSMLAGLPTGLALPTMITPVCRPPRSRLSYRPCLAVSAAGSRPLPQRVSERPGNRSTTTNVRRCPSLRLLSAACRQQPRPYHSYTRISANCCCGVQMMRFQPRMCGRGHIAAHCPEAGLNQTSCSWPLPSTWTCSWCRR